MASVKQFPGSANWYACYRLPNGKRVQRSTGQTDEAAAKQIAIGYEKAAMSAAGQRAMCDDASSRATAFNLAAFLRRRNVPTYDDAFIASANAITLAAIKDELVADYNKAITQGHSALHGT